MIEREIKKKITDTLNLKEITILTGARQVGKTTILKLIMDELKKKGKSVVSFNLDIEEDASYFESQQKLLNKIVLECGNSPAYVFIDEIQQKEKAGRFLKGIYDMGLPYKIVVSGSGSMELKEQIGEALTGRKILINMWPVTFLEFIEYKTHGKYKQQLKLFFETETEKASLLLFEYLVYGGYPAVITATTIDRKLEIMREVFGSYITKDISFLLGVRQPDKFVRLIQLLANLAGNILNYSNVSQKTSLRVETLKTYLWYAEQTFIVQQIKPFFTNPVKELTKSPVVYFYDTGMLNFSKNNFRNSAIDGMLFQNFIFQFLKQKYEQGLMQIKYWRTKDKAEVDFIVEKENKIIPVEVKYKALKKPEISRSYRSFLKKYQPDTGIIVNLLLDQELRIDNTLVKIIPYWKLMFAAF